MSPMRTGMPACVTGAAGTAASGCRSSLGLWHNFGGTSALEAQRAVLRRAFDLGVTHIDLANNYGTPFGTAEANFGVHYRADFRPYRDELFLATKAGKRDARRAGPGAWNCCAHWTYWRRNEAGHSRRRRSPGCCGTAA